MEIIEKLNEDHKQIADYLIDKLHEEHREIIGYLNNIKAKMDGDPEALKEEFKGLKKLLIFHLINEDNYLYPALRTLEETKKISESFEDEMGQISSEIMDFYAIYESEEVERSLNNEIENVAKKLVYRIRKEEVELYPLYKTYFPKK